jgi:hypothetical protein
MKVNFANLVHHVFVVECDEAKTPVSICHLQNYFKFNTQTNILTRNLGIIHQQLKLLKVCTNLIIGKHGLDSAELLKVSPYHGRA